MESNVIGGDIRRQKSVGILMGVCVTFALLFAAFELTDYDKRERADEDEEIYNMVMEEDMIPITHQEEPQPVAPPVVNNDVQPEVLQIVEDEVEIKEEKIETTEDTNVPVIGTVGTGAPTAVASTGPVSAGPVVEVVEDENIYEVVEQNAQFPGGDEACYKWLSDHIKYPSICQEQGIQGRVFVSFVVNKDGSIVDVKVLRSPDDNLSKEAVRVVKEMPKWKPARQGNRTVRSRFNLPVMFRLN